MPNRFWKNKKIVVTGGSGFLGTHLVKYLRKDGAVDLFIPTHQDFDLRNKADASKAVAGADIVIHLAAHVGGIGYNLANPAQLYYDNLLMGTHLMEESRQAGVKKFVAIGTICAYPKVTPIPFHEHDLWNGYPEETNAPYGLAKKMLLVQAQAYRKQYDFNAIYLLPVNMYGPGDNFDPQSSHVVPALIKKCMDAVSAGASQIEVWGTGTPTREFLYVEDAARAIALATEKYNHPDPVNLGSHMEISIKELITVIAELTGFSGKIVFDSSKPDGQPRRKLDTTKAETEFGFKAAISFREGLKKTIEWYSKNRT